MCLFSNSAYILNNETQNESLACFSRNADCNRLDNSANFYREIKVGPLLGMPKRPYWEIIQNVEPEIPDYALEQNLLPEMYDARLPLTRLNRLVLRT